MADPTDIELHAMGEESASGSGDAIDIGAARSAVRLALIVSSAAGTTPVLTCTLQTSRLEDGPWKSAGTFRRITAEGDDEKVFAGLQRYVRVSWETAGTLPVFEFSIAGQAHSLYAEPKDLTRTAINAAAIAEVDKSVLADCCLRATADAETALNSAFEMPITAWGEDLRGHVAARAVYYVMDHRGRRPGAGPDERIDLAGGFRTSTNVKSAAQVFFEAVASGALKPVGIVDQTPDDYEGGGVVVSGASVW